MKRTTHRLKRRHGLARNRSMVQRSSRRLLFESLEQKCLLAGDVPAFGSQPTLTFQTPIDGVAEGENSGQIMTNPDLREDVNGSGFVTPLDALLLINQLPSLVSLGDRDLNGLFVDTNEDQQFTLADVNRVMTALRALEAGEPIDELVTSDAPGLLSLQLDVLQDGVSLLDSNGEAQLAPGHRFELEVQYEDLRGQADQLGAFALFVDLASNQPNTFRPVTAEVQRIVFSDTISSATGGNLVFSVEGSDETSEVTFEDFADDSMRAVAIAVEELLGPGAFEDLNFLQTDGLGFQLQFLSGFDAPAVLVDTSGLTGAVVDAETFVIPALLEDGSVNPAAIPFSVNTASSTFFGNPFYLPSPEANLFSVTEDLFLRGWGGSGQVADDGGGIPSLLGDVPLPQPFSAFSITLEVLEDAENVVFEVGQAASPDTPTLLYGLDNALSASQVIGGERDRVVLDFVTPNPLVLSDAEFVLAEDSSLVVDLTTLVVSGVPFNFDTFSSSENGQVQQTGSLIEYFPNPDFFGTDSVVYFIGDGENVESATITFAVTPVNDPPIANLDQVFATGNTPLRVPISDLLANDDPGPFEGDQVLQLESVVASDSGATVQIDGDVVIYTPPFQFRGSDRFSYRVSDGEFEAATDVDVVVDFPLESLNLVLGEDQPRDLVVRRDADFVEVFDLLAEETLLSRPLDSVEQLGVVIENSQANRVTLLDGSALPFEVTLRASGEGDDTLIVEETIANAVALDASQANSLAGPLRVTPQGAGDFDSLTAIGFESVTIGAIDEIEITENLTVGDGDLILNTDLPVDLPLLTSISGGSISSASLLALTAGESLVGSGVIAARVAGEVGSLVRATGTLTVGDPESPAGVELRGDLEIGGHEVVLQDANRAVLGALTSLGTQEGDASVSGVLSSETGLIVALGGNLVGTGTIDTPNDPNLPVTINGVVEGASEDARLAFTGFVGGVGSFDQVTFDGVFSPGLSPTISDNGSVRYTELSQLIIELGGASPGSGFDQINHSGIAELVGTLGVELINGFAPSGGESFTILTAAGTLINNLGDIQLPELAEGLSWTVRQTPNALQLEVEVDTEQLSGELIVEVVDGQLTVRSGGGVPIPVVGDRLRLQVQPTDDFSNAGGFENLGTEVVDGEFVQRVAAGDLELEIVGSGWTNYINPADVDGSGEVTALDALLIINNLLRTEFFTSDDFDLIDPVTVTEFPGTFYDVSGDRRGSALDALQVINRIAQAGISSESGEGEAIVPQVGQSFIGINGSAADEAADLPIAPLAVTDPRLPKLASFDSVESLMDAVVIDWSLGQSVEVESQEGLELEWVGSL